MKDIARLNELYLEYGSQEMALEMLNKVIISINSVSLTLPTPPPPATIKIPEVKIKKPKSLWKMYKKEVWHLTNLQDLKSLENIDKRGFRGYHLDHKVSVMWGFKNNISPALIGHISNLRMIPYKENMLKSKYCFWDDKNTHIKSCLHRVDK